MKRWRGPFRRDYLRRDFADSSQFTSIQAFLTVDPSSCHAQRDPRLPRIRHYRINHLKNSQSSLRHIMMIAELKNKKWLIVQNRCWFKVMSRMFSMLDLKITRLRNIIYTDNTILLVSIINVIKQVSIKLSSFFDVKVSWKTSNWPH